MSDFLVWSDRAKYELTILDEYLTEEWGDEMADRIIREINAKAIHIQNYPEHYPIYNKRKNIRRCVFSTQTSIYYRITTDYIELLSIFDNRQNPQKRKF
jgi:plasmid stabilization system protein ParE